MAISGHRSAGGVMAYKELSHNQEEEMSRITQKRLRSSVSVEQDESRDRESKKKKQIQAINTTLVVV